MSKALKHNQIASLIKGVGAKRTVLVEGEFGIGKSAIFHTLSSMPEFTGYHKSMVDCTNLSDGSVWMPDIDRARSVSRELPNERFGVSDENHKGIDGARPALICLDELAKARQFVKDTLAPLIYERRVGSYALPEGSIVFATTNLTDEGLGDSMLQHLRNRVIIVSLQKPTKDEWVQDFAVPNNLNENVIAAAEMYPMVFSSFMDYRPGGMWAGKKMSADNPYISDPSNASQGQVVTPRSLHAASDVLEARTGMDEDTLNHALAGAVGMPFAANIMSMIRFGDQLPAYERVVADPAGTPIPNNPTCCVVQCFQFVKQVQDKEEAEAVSEYVNRMKAEMKSLFVNVIANTKGGGKLANFSMSATFLSMLRENRTFLGV